MAPSQTSEKTKLQKQQINKQKQKQATSILSFILWTGCPFVLTFSTKCLCSALVHLKVIVLQISLNCSSPYAHPERFALQLTSPHYHEQAYGLIEFTFG